MNTKKVAEKTSYIMESIAISLGNFQGKEFTVDNENEDVKENWIIPMTLEDIIYKIKN